jgi:hypothetical protein
LRRIFTGSRLGDARTTQNQTMDDRCPPDADRRGPKLTAIGNRPRPAAPAEKQQTKGRATSSSVIQRVAKQRHLLAHGKADSYDVLKYEVMLSGPQERSSRTQSKPKGGDPLRIKEW